MANRIQSQTQKSILRLLCDAGWNTAIEVDDGKPDVVLGPEESQWLEACWRAARGRTR